MPAISLDPDSSAYLSWASAPSVRVRVHRVSLEATSTSASAESSGRAEFVNHLQPISRARMRTEPVRKEPDGSRASQPVENGLGGPAPTLAPDDSLEEIEGVAIRRELIFPVVRAVLPLEAGVG